MPGYLILECAMRGLIEKGRDTTAVMAVLLMLCAGTIRAAGQPASEPPAQTPPKTQPAPPATEPVPAGQPPAGEEKIDPKVNSPLADRETQGEKKMIQLQLQDGSLKMPEGFDPQVIVKRDANGKLVRYDRPLPWVAYEMNPLITDQQRTDLQKVFDRRQMMHELAVVNDLDLVMKVDQGAFENIDPRDRRSLAWADRTQKQLRAGGSLSEWMYNQGALTDVQAGACQLLGQAYTEALLKEISGPVKDKPDATADEKLAVTREISREVYYIRVDEPLFVYRRMLERAANNIDQCIQHAQLPAEVYASVQSDVEAIRAAKSDEEKRSTVTSLLAKLPDWVMQHRFMDAAASVKFSDRSSQINGRVITPVMAYQVEEQRRREAAAKGNTVPYQKEPPRPSR
jgi:hypothetical protein